MKSVFSPFSRTYCFFDFRFNILIYMPPKRRSKMGGRGRGRGRGGAKFLERDRGKAEERTDEANTNPLEPPHTNDNLMKNNDITDQLAFDQEVEESAASRVCSSSNNVASEIIQMIKIPHPNGKENVNESGENYRKEDIIPKESEEDDARTPAEEHLIVASTTVAATAPPDLNAAKNSSIEVDHNYNALDIQKNSVSRTLAVKATTSTSTVQCDEKPAAEEEKEKPQKEVEDKAEEDRKVEEKGQAVLPQSSRQPETNRRGWLEGVDVDPEDDTDEDEDSSSHYAGDAMLTTAEKTEKMKTMFQNGLKIHFAGEEMEACRAVSTQLFPHQRVALAWMFNHENKQSEGMLGGILADDMGLGKSLTVVALIMTNFWDGKPLCKPDLGFIRPPLTSDQRGVKGKGKLSKPRPTAQQLGVGSKLQNQVKKTSGIFSKMRKLSSDSDSEEGSRPSFSFGLKKIRKKRMNRANENDEMNLESDSEDQADSSDLEFINDDSSDLGDWDESEEETKVKSKMNRKMNVDGLIDASSSEDELQPASKRRRKASPMDSDQDDENPKENFGSTGAKEDSLLENESIKNVSPAELEDDVDGDNLPSPKMLKRTKTVEEEEEEQPRASSEERGERNKNRNGPLNIRTRVNKETGLKMIIPPRQPAEQRGRRRATLLVCPTSLISHWAEQLDRHLDQSVRIKLRIHHGQSKAESGAELEDCDIVITTYGTLQYEGSAVQQGPLLKAKWLRVVLDEGHYIKNHNSKTAKAAVELNTLRRWIITGTPIQNNLLEFWSLINFLKFGLYAGKGNMRYFKYEIDRLCKEGNPIGFERLQVLIDAVCLRRTKTDKRPDGSPIVTLPNKTIITREVELSEDERTVYDVYLTHFQMIVAKYHRRGDLLRNYAHVFAMMMR